MKTRLTTSILLAMLFGLSLVWSVTASGPSKGEETTSIRAMEQISASSVGEPQFNFRYIETFGVTEEAYISDTTHLNAPGGLFIDSSDNLYVAEKFGQRLLIFDSSGTFSQSLGSAGERFTTDDGDTFEDPKDVTIDPDGNIWLADADRVIQFDTAGNLLQMFPATDPWRAGSGNDRFDGPESIAFDSAGRMYVAEDGNYRVQVFTFDVNGTPVYSTTIGETGVAGNDNSHFESPHQIAIDSQDRLYVADTWSPRIQRCSYSSGWSCTTFHGGSYGSGDNEVDSPIGVSVDSSDNVYIADTNNGRVKKCTSAGVCNSSFITGLSNPYDVAFDSSGNIYVSDFKDFTIRKFNSNGDSLGTYLGMSGAPYQADNSHFNTPHGIGVDDSGNIYLTTDRGFRALKMDAGGSVLWSVGMAGVWGDDNAHFGGIWNGAHDIALDSTGKIYVVDTGNDRVQIFNSGGSYQATLGTGWGQGNYEFGAPKDIAFDASDNLFVADEENHRVQIFDSNLNHVATMGQTGVSGSDNSHFDHPVGVTIDSSGNIYVADFDNYRVQVFNKSRNHIMTLGETGVSGDDNSHFVAPHDVAVDAIGRIYVADAWNDRVQVFENDGSYLATIGGGWGPGPAELRGPTGVAVDRQNNVYIADTGNHRIQKFAPGVPGWAQVNENGFGNRNSGGITALEPFNGQLYAAASNWNEGGKIWRASSSWSSVTSPGFGNSNNGGIFDLHEFGGRLYAGTWNSPDGGAVWRSDTNGDNWQKVSSDGFGVGTNTGAYPFATFSNALYVATDSYTDTIGVDVWCSPTGNSGEWSKVAGNGFNDVNSKNITGFAEFNSRLYAAVANYTDGIEIWRTTNNTACGTSWEAVVADEVDGDTSGTDENGFGDSDNDDAGALVIFNGALYVATKNETTGGQIWRSPDGSTWSQVVGDGFGDIGNEKVESLVVFDNRIYAVTGNHTTGVEVWQSTDGTTWTEQVNPDGWGDSNNEATLWANASTVFSNSLYIGTWNWGNGGEVWQLIGTFTTVDSSTGNTSSFTDTDGITTTVDIPTSSLTEDIFYVFTSRDALEYPATGGSFAGRAFAMDVYKDGQALLSYTFAQSITVVVRYTDADVSGGNEDELMLLYWNGSQWADAACGSYIRNPAGNWFSVPICHLSEFAMFGNSQEVFLPIVLK